MAGNLEQFFGSDGFTQANVTTIKNVDSPEIQLRNAMAQNGIEPPDTFYFDGRVHRFHGGGKNKHDKTCWYVLFRDPIPAGSFGDWRLGSSIIFRADTGRELTSAEQIALTNRQHEAKKLRDEELERERKSASETAELIWNRTSQIADASHPYLERKRINHHGARVTGDGRLIVPLMDESGKITSLQYISSDGEKRYHPSGETKGKFWVIGEPSDTIYIAEGFATSASIYEATECMTIIAYSASNLVPVTEIIRKQFPLSKVIIVADNDASGVGLKYADQASAKYGARVITPPDLGDANDYVNNGGDLKGLLIPNSNGLTLLDADNMAENAKAPDYIINNILENDSHGLIVAQSQCFKTFMALHICHCICTGNSFFGNAIFKPGKVIYVCGEGKGALARRLRGLKLKYGGFNNNLLILEQRIGIDDNIDMSALNKLIEEHKPVLVVFDTFASLVTNTDENSNKEVGMAINLIRSTCSDAGASSMAIHHTGKVGTSARGAYSFAGNSDFLFNMTREDGSMNVIFSCFKMKDGDNFADIHVTAEPIDIGLERQDGSGSTTLILKLNDSPTIENKKDSKLTGFIKLFKRAWIENKGETFEGLPYITRSALFNFLVKNEGYKERTAENKLDAGREGDFINVLLNSEVISKTPYGWKVNEGEISSAFLIEFKG
jgi:phage/plasmid primase-like uncharacterized protein